MSIDFSDSALLSYLDTCSEEQFEALPFGAIKMNHQNIIERYNQAQCEITGYETLQVLGKEFFRDVAPCTHHYMVSEQYMMNSELDSMVHFTFNHNLKPITVKLRLLKSASSQYLLTERLD